MHTHEIPFKYLKQYTCLQMKQYFNSPTSPASLYKINFDAIRPELYGQQRLRTEVVDKTLDYEILYIFKWSFSQPAILDIFIFNQDKFIRIQMNRKPIIANISDGNLYLIGDNNLYIISLINSHSIASYPITNDEIHALQPAYFEKQFGVILYTRNNKTGFKSRKFSPGFIEKDTNIISKVTSMFFPKKIITNGSLKIILPNILGLVILSKSHYCLINLSNMEILQQTRKRLTGWQIQKFTNISVKYHQNSRSHGFDDSLVISIAERNFIQIITIHIKYDEGKKNEHNINQDKIPLISTLTNAYLIDWEKIVALNYMCLYIEGSLIDYIMLDDGIIYYSERNSKNKIPSSNFVYYKNPLVKYPIICLQHNIWRQYLIDKTFEVNSQQRIQLNRLLIPNRYSLQFLLKSTGKQSFRDIDLNLINQKKLIIDWTNAFKINKILAYKSDIIIIRNSAITSFLQVTEHQFKLQYYNNLPQTWDMLSLNDKQSYNLSAETDNYENMEQIKKSYDFAYERCLISEAQPKKSTEDQNPFSEYIQQFQHKLMNPHEVVSVYGALQNKSSVFAQQMLVNRVKDIILFFTEILTSNFSHPKNQQQDYKQCLDYKTGMQQQLIIHYLNVFTKIINQPAEQISNQGIDTMHSFINKHKPTVILDENQQYIVNVDRQCWMVISNLFYDILPYTSTQIHYKNSNQINQFVKILINNIKVNKNNNQTLFSLFSYLLTRSPDNSFISNSIFYALYSIPMSDNYFNRYYKSYTLKIMNEIKQGEHLHQEEGINQFLKNLRNTWSLTRQQRNKIKETLYQFLTFLEPIKTNPKRRISQNQLQQKMDEQTGSVPRADLQKLNVKKLATKMNLISMQTIEEYLKTIQNEQDLQTFFSINLQIEMALPYNSNPQPKSQAKTEELFVGWILYYRIYVWKYNGLIQKLNNQKQKYDNEKNKQKQVTFLRTSSVGGTNTIYQTLSQSKQIAKNYIQNCVKGFENARYYYQELTGMSVADEELIVQAGQYFIYGSLAISKWLKIIEKALSDENFQNYLNRISIGKFHIGCILSEKKEDLQAIKQLQELHQFFSKKQLGGMICNEGMKKLYDQQSDKIKAFFGYADINMNSLTRNKDFMSQMQFRNAYIEAQFGKVL